MITNRQEQGSARDLAMQQRVWRMMTLATVLSLCTVPSVAAQYAGRTILEGAKTEKSPLKNACRRNKGRQVAVRRELRELPYGLGKGDGPDSNEATNLTDPFRPLVNLWFNYANNMPAFNSTLTEDEV